MVRLRGQRWLRMSAQRRRPHRGRQRARVWAWRARTARRYRMCAMHVGSGMLQLRAPRAARFQPRRAVRVVVVASCRRCSGHRGRSGALRAL